ncbi:unnamed protein product [Rhizoctonia solani]|uniref:AMP-dependent synthetase/ligase domain-containing protein n=1 Tax=Rhizoctonia solani TaxID=456999 RepID=A0A8H2WW32_9AGAM|nr:unnamed protein product [Rhizoctonia solani]
MLCSGYDQAWIEAREKQFDGVIVQLPKEEQADQLVKSEKQGHLSTLPWPAPQRPTPAVILHSSGTTTNPKLFRMSLYTFTIRLTETCRTHLSLAGLKRTSKTPRTHPRFIAAPFYWTSTFYYIFTHLVTATPMAFGSFVDIYQAPPGDLIDWGIALDAGAMTWPSGPARLIPRATYEAHAEFLRTLYSFSFTGSTMSKALSQVFEELKIPIVNLYGSSELGRVLYSWKPPYTHLRPCRDVSPPLIHPISDYDTDGTRHVELWITPIASPILAHYLAHGGVPLKLEPFPGDGPYKGELAVNLDDIFREVKVGDQDGSTETVYIHMGRHTDEVRLGEGGFGSIDATEYEGTIELEINSRIGGVGGCPWKLDGAQLFGNNMSCTALVIQLRLDRNFEGPDHGADPAKSLPIAELQESVERTNDILGLAGCKRVHPGKRTLVVSSDGAVLHGPGGESVSGTFASLSMTHKSTLKRWENVYKFKPWLDALDFS